MSKLACFHATAHAEGGGKCCYECKQELDNGSPCALTEFHDMR